MRRRGVREAAGRDDDGRKTEFRSEGKVQKQLKKEKDGSRGRGRKTRANASVPSQDDSVARSWNRPAHACLGQGGKRVQMNLPGGGNDVAKVRRGGGAGSRVTKCHQPRRRGNERGREKKKTCSRRKVLHSLFSSNFFGGILGRNATIEASLV